MGYKTGEEAEKRSKRIRGKCVSVKVWIVIHRKVTQVKHNRQKKKVKVRGRQQMSRSNCKKVLMNIRNVH